MLCDSKVKDRVNLSLNQGQDSLQNRGSPLVRPLICILHHSRGSSCMRCGLLEGQFSVYHHCYTRTITDVLITAGSLRPVTRTQMPVLCAL